MNIIEGQQCQNEGPKSKEVIVSGIVKAENGGVKVICSGLTRSTFSAKL